MKRKKERQWAGTNVGVQSVAKQPPWVPPKKKNSEQNDSEEWKKQLPFLTSLLHARFPREQEADLEQWAERG